MKKLLSLCFAGILAITLTGCQSKYDLSKLPIYADETLDVVEYTGDSNKNTENTGLSVYLLFSKQSTAQLDFTYKHAKIINESTGTAVFFNDFYSNDKDGTSQDRLIEYYGDNIKKYFDDKNMHAYLMVIQSSIPYTSDDLKSQILDSVFDGKLNPEESILFLVNGPVMTKVNK